MYMCMCIYMYMTVVFTNRALCKFYCCVSPCKNSKVPQSIHGAYGLLAHNRTRKYLSSDRPQAMTETSLGRPMGSSISGLNTPELPTSTHFFRPDTRETITIAYTIARE